ncbi:hypothetical protein HOH87_07090 [bacterium]|jgi:hypothetical protein|nr:hypothetical protein [bacterium]
MNVDVNGRFQADHNLRILNTRPQRVDTSTEEVVAEEMSAEEQDRKSKLKESVLTKRSNRKDKSIMGKLLGDFQEAKEAREELLVDAFKQSAQKSAKKKGPLKKSIENELDKLFSGSEAKDDTVVLSQIALKNKGVNQKDEAMFTDKMLEELEAEDQRDVKKGKGQMASQKAGTTQQGQLRRRQSTQRHMQQQTIKDYATSIAEYFGDQKPAKKHVMEKMKREMLSKGVATKDVLDVESKVGETVKQHYVYDLKKKLLKHFFSQSEANFQKTFSKMEFQIKANEMEAIQREGLLKSPIHEVMEKLGVELRREMEGFLYEEATRRFGEHSVGDKTIEEYTDDLAKLQKVAAASGVIIDELGLTESIKRAIESEGLELFEAPDNMNSSMSFGGNNSNPDQSKGEPQIYVNQEELLEDKLRNMYMMKAYNPSLGNQIKVEFKMKKLRNGLIKLGINIQERDEELEKEGRFLAQMKLVDELRDTLREQATLIKLSGPDYTLVKAKKAFVLKGLRKLGNHIKPKEVKRVQDEMNREMFGIIREEYNQLETMLEVKHDIHVYRNFKLLEGVLVRLKKESKIQVPLSIHAEYNTPLFNRNISEAV